MLGCWVQLAVRHQTWVVESELQPSVRAAFLTAGHSLQVPSMIVALKFSEGGIFFNKKLKEILSFTKGVIMTSI